MTIRTTTAGSKVYHKNLNLQIFDYNVSIGSIFKRSVFPLLRLPVLKFLYNARRVQTIRTDR